jgi:hypothetical protein
VTTWRQVPLHHGGARIAWDATLRIFIAANVVGKGPIVAAQSLPGSTPPSTPLHMQPSGTTPGLLVPGAVGGQATSALNMAVLNKGPTPGAGQQSTCRIRYGTPSSYSGFAPQTNLGIVKKN